ncbi:MAG: hypothetical protein PWR18_946 [Synergistales bacterium]|jgi:type I restriction enzyme S subunit|nr:hypothetical protein [Synergistales bacterium]
MLEILNTKTETISGLPEGYRMTELGPLPEEWRVVRSEEVVALRKDTSESVNRKAAY